MRREPLALLMSEAVSEPDIRSQSCRLATVLEEQFIVAGWPSGQVFSSVEKLQRYYGVSRKTVSEVIRILEVRSTARLRRGSSSGLEVSQPEPVLVAEMLRGFGFLTHVSADHRIEALAFLSKVQKRIPRAQRSQSAQFASGFLRDLIRDQFTPGLPPVGVGLQRLRKNRAGQIALDLMDRYCVPAESFGEKIGSEALISTRYKADRSITRQAIRILENAELVVCMPGRGHGIVTRRPGLGPVCRLTCCYLASQHFPVSGAFELFWAMSIEAIALVAHKANAEDLRRFQQVFAASWDPARSARLGNICFTEDALFSAIKNPLIDLFIRSLRGYVSIVATRSGEDVPDEVARCFADNTEQVFVAVSRHNAKLAVAAHERKLNAIRELEKRHHPQVANLLYIH